MSLSKKVVLTVSGYKISLSDSLQFYQNDQLKLIFEINKYGIDVASSFTHKTLMPLQPLTATLFIETPLGVDSIESANIEDNAVTFYLTSNQTQHIGISTMQIKLTDDDGCQITLPSFTFEVQKNIYDNAVHVSGILLADENGNVLSDENGNTINATATTESSKQIKDFSLKTGVSGQEDILVQDNGVTKRIKSNELIDTVDLTGYATETYVQNKIAEASLSGGEVDLSGYATKDDLNTKADKSAIPTKVSQLTNDKGYLTSHQNISGKADKTYVDTELAKKANTSHTHSYNDLTDKPTIPNTTNLATKTELTNGLATKADKVHTHDQYLTEHQDISMKADKTELHSHSNKTVLDGITSAKVTEWNNKSTFDGNYNSLTNKPTIPTVDVNKNYVDTQLAKKANKSDIPSLNGYATETYVQNKIAEASLSGGEVDLSGYATKDDLNTKADKSAIPTKVSQLTNDKGYLTSHQNISGKADKTYVDTELAKKANTSHTHSYNDLTDKPTIPNTTNLATKTELTNGLATKADKVHTHDQYLTEHQDISMKADKTELHSHSNKTVLDGITSAKVTEWNNKSTFDGNYNSLTNKPTIPTVDVTKSYVDTQLAKKSDTSHNHDTVYSKLDHTHTGMLTSNSITRIEVVDVLPGQQENGVLYIVKGE